MSQSREHWGSRLGFALAAIGSAVGLGMLWKFPYTMGENGGGLFLFTYFLCVIAIGIPTLVGELLLGRRSQRAAVGAFSTLAADAKKNWKVAGWFGVLSSFFIMSFYSVIAGWGMSYILMSLSGLYATPIEEIPQLFTKLSHSGSITLFWHCLFTLITMAIVRSGVRKGIEFWSKIMTRALLLILVALLLYSISLSGFRTAVHFIFAFNTDTFKFSSALEALGLAFFTLSLGQGIMISYGSYTHKEENLPRMACIIGFAVMLIAIFVSLIIFPVIFTFGFPPQQGMGLVFHTLPYLFAQLPGSPILSTVFFTLFLFTALTSAVPFIEVVTTNLMELFGWTRKRTALLVAGGTFLFGIPSALSHSNSLFANWRAIYGGSFLETIDSLVSIWMIPIGGLLTSIFIGWAMHRESSRAEFPEGKRWVYIHRIWYGCMRWVIPLIISLIILQKSGLIDFDRLNAAHH